MAFVFDTDPNSAGFNSFTTVEFANNYLESKLNTAWFHDDPQNEKRQNALIWASRQLSSLRWKGKKTEITQNLAFPRKYLYIDGVEHGSQELYESVQFDWYTVPQFVQEATADLAGDLFVSDTTADSGLAEFERIKIDVIELETKNFGTSTWQSKSLKDLIWRYLESSSSGVNVRTRRVG